MLIVIILFLFINIRIMEIIILIITKFAVAILVENYSNILSKVLMS